MYNYNIFVMAGQCVVTQWINTDVNLLEMYKAALASGAKVISWEKGVLNLTSIVGIVDNSPVSPSSISK